jgi:hypothetical protein
LSQIGLLHFFDKAPKGVDGLTPDFLSWENMEKLENA